MSIDSDPLRTEELHSIGSRTIVEGLTYDDVLLVPGRSEVLPTEVETTTRISPRIKLNAPLVSAAMDTVTEARMAITLARAGGWA